VQRKTRRIELAGFLTLYFSRGLLGRPRLSRTYQTLVKASSARLSEIGKPIKVVSELPTSDGPGDDAAQLRYAS